MKKREVIKQKKKLKQVQNIKYLKFSKNACILLIMMFLLYVGVVSSLLQKPIEELLRYDPIVIVGFMICTANLYIWYVLKNFINDIKNLEHIESIRLNLIVMAVGQFILLNYISAFLMIIALKKYFQWNSFSFKKEFAEMKKDKQLSVFVVTCIILALFSSLVFGIYFSIKK